jgi:hypothetical protein
MIPSVVIGHIRNAVQYKPAHMMPVKSREGDSHYRVMRNSHREIQIGVPLYVKIMRDGLTKTLTEAFDCTGTIAGFPFRP